MPQLDLLYRKRSGTWWPFADGEYGLWHEVARSQRQQKAQRHRWTLVPDLDRLLWRGLYSPVSGIDAFTFSDFDH
jgi:hypothetical protein